MEYARDAACLLLTYLACRWFWREIERDRQKRIQKFGETLKP